MVIAAGAWQQAGSHGTRAGAEGLHLGSKHEAKKALLAIVWTFETPRPALGDTPPPTRPKFLVFSKKFHQAWTKNSNI